MSIDDIESAMIDSIKVEYEGKIKELQAEIARLEGCREKEIDAVRLLAPRFALVQHPASPSPALQGAGKSTVREVMMKAAASFGRVFTTSELFASMAALYPEGRVPSQNTLVANFSRLKKAGHFDTITAPAGTSGGTYKLHVEKAD